MKVKIIGLEPSVTGRQQVIFDLNGIACKTIVTMSLHAIKETFEVELPTLEYKGGLYPYRVLKSNDSDIMVVEESLNEILVADLERGDVVAEALDNKIIGFAEEADLLLCDESLLNVLKQDGIID